MMNSSELQTSILTVAYGADLLIGDPRWFPHPVRAMGLAIHWGERILRRLIPWERVAGLLLVAGLVGGTYAGTRWLLEALHVHAAGWGFVAGAVLLFSCLSTRDLAIESREVLRALEAEDLPLARRRVARIVGRETQRLDQPEIVRATIETIAESTMDGILSPLFYAVVGGVPLAMTYKAINTLDSMIGHRSARYLRFGSAAARLDTWANWIPARWSVFVFTLAAAVGGGRVRQSWRCAWSHHLLAPPSAESQNPVLGWLRCRVLRRSAHGRSQQVVGWRPSAYVPNAGLPEAAMAGALGVRLGGVNWYEGKAVTMAFMGEPVRPLTPERIREAIRLMYAASAIGWLVALAVLVVKGKSIHGLQ